MEVIYLSFENKEKKAFWFYPETLTGVETHYKHDNCRSKSEFIEKAIKFYIGYLDEENSVNYISPLISETVKAEIKGTEQRLSRLMFKVAVELAKLAQMTASMYNGDEESVRDLHAYCINEVRRINGIINCEDAVAYQQG